MTTVNNRDIDNLKSVIHSTLHLLQQFQATLSNDGSSNATDLPTGSPKPLPVLKTSAILLKAHTTKLSLLILNKPFTPSAIRTIIHEMSSTCLPAMMSAVEICRAENYGKILRTEVKIRVKRTFKEIEALIEEVSAHIYTEEFQNGKSNAKIGRGTLASTGVVWEACDALIELEKLGIVGLVIKHVQEYKEMVEDAIAELKVWSEDVTEEDEDVDEELTSSCDHDSIEDVFGAANRLPRNRNDLALLMNATLKKLKLISTFYQALIKRRLKTISTSLNSARSNVDGIEIRYIESLDNLLDILKTIPETVDDLANAFYELDAEEAQKLLETSCQKSKHALSLVTKSWAGDEDEFTAWSIKWSDAMIAHSN